MIKTYDRDALLALPDKLSDLLELALSDLEKVEALPKYKVDMMQWHTSIGGVCAVCLAGSVLAMTGKMEYGRNISASMLPRPIADKLLAMDALREGRVYAAEFYLSGKGSIDALDVVVTPYYQSPELFKADIRRLIHLLREREL
jgi:hypothetical protein